MVCVLNDDIENNFYHFTVIVAITLTRLSQVASDPLPSDSD